MRTCPNCQRTFSDDTDFCPRDGTPLPAVVTATAAQLPAGLSQRFRIVRQIGAGGMGAVFLAEQIQVGNRPVALKVLLRKLLDDPEFLLRFQNEAASTGRIHHPNVVTIYESGQADDGTPYIAMEYLEGETLRNTIQRRGALPLAECAEIIQQVARGLSSAHRLGIIHRDLKPDNIFLTCSEEGDLAVKVVDFGIAKLRESATHTMTGMVLGTPQYMSFEQASGMRSEKLDARSDLYSLGIIAYEMLTGRLPFHSDTPLGYLRGHLTETPPPIRTVNPALAASDQIEDVVMKALAKDRDQRYGSVMEFAQEFAKAAGVIVAAAGATLPTTRKVVPLPASDPEPASSGKSGGGTAEPAVQYSLPKFQSIAGVKQPQPRQQAPSAVIDLLSPGEAHGSLGGQTMDGSRKPCPYCSGDIRVDAKLCNHCGRKLPHPIPAWRWVLYTILGAAAFGLFFYNLGRRPEADRQNQGLVADMAKMPISGIPDNRQGIARSQLEPKTAAALPAGPPPPTPVRQVLVSGSFDVRPNSYSMFPFTVPSGATQVKIRGSFRAFGGAGDDIQIVIGSPSDFDNWIKGGDIDTLYDTGKVSTGTINPGNLAPGDYVLGFSNMFSIFTRRKVTALVTLSYVP